MCPRRHAPTVIDVTGTTSYRFVSIDKSNPECLDKSNSECFVPSTRDENRRSLLPSYEGAQIHQGSDGLHWGNVSYMEANKAVLYQSLLARHSSRDGDNSNCITPIPEFTIQTAPPNDFATRLSSLSFACLYFLYHPSRSPLALRFGDM